MIFEKQLFWEGGETITWKNLRFLWWTSWFDPYSIIIGNFNLENMKETKMVKFGGRGYQLFSNSSFFGWINPQNGSDLWRALLWLNSNCIQIFCSSSIRWTCIPALSRKTTRQCGSERKWLQSAAIWNLPCRYGCQYFLRNQKQHIWINSNTFDRTRVNLE